jgi:hypothetical protein
MRTAKNENGVRMAVELDKETYNKSLTLRTKYSMNMSSLCRNMICDLYEKLEASKETNK